MTRTIIETDSSEPVLVLVIPLRKCERPAPAAERRTIETSGHELPCQAAELRRTA